MPSPDLEHGKKRGQKDKQFQNMIRVNRIYTMAKGECLRDTYSCKSVFILIAKANV